jgi:hypothetical protein
MATPLPPLPGETPEQRRARLSAADAVQARIDAQKRAELEAQAEARRKEMQALIDNMLRSAYVLPPLPQLPVPMPEMAAPVMREPMPPSPVKTTRPDPNVIQSTIVTADGYVPNPAYTADVAMQRYRAELLNNNYYSPQERQQIMSSIENAYAQPGATGQQVKDAYQNASAAATQARHREQEARNAAYYAQQPPAPLSNLPPDVVAKPIDPYLRELITPVPSPPPIPTYYDPVPPVEQPTPPPMQPPTQVDPGFVMDIPMFRPPMQPPTQVDPGFVMDIPTFRPPMQPPEPYTPPSMQFSVDMPRMDYARDLYGVIPDNVSMLKRGGLAVKPKKGKC